MIVNDTGGLPDPEMRAVVAGTDVAAVAVYVEGANPHQVDEIEIRSDKAVHTAAEFAELLVRTGGRGDPTT